MWLVRFEIAAYRGSKKLEDDGDASFSGSETCRRRMQCVIKYFSVVYTVCLYVSVFGKSTEAAEEYEAKYQSFS